MHPPFPNNDTIPPVELNRITIAGNKILATLKQNWYDGLVVLLAHLSITAFSFVFPKEEETFLDTCWSTTVGLGLPTMIGLVCCGILELCSLLGGILLSKKQKKNIEEFPITVTCAVLAWLLFVLLWFFQSKITWITTVWIWRGFSWTIGMTHARFGFTTSKLFPRTSFLLQVCVFSIAIPIVVGVSRLIADDLRSDVLRVFLSFMFHATMMEYDRNTLKFWKNKEIMLQKREKAFRDHLKRVADRDVQNGIGEEVEEIPEENPEPAIDLQRPNQQGILRRRASAY
ncbi:hypothetical protein CAEBREN_17781 [Caenorhabditis brenneri]|uniref:Transmembrane protein n=1 Tax=Caenorhabditis brenneri TaxID=135651 RepID=G0MRM1_CAEBE|nr:hypothetical protein CAEBREN_17781 [Caenorhabditis brenneri]